MGLLRLFILLDFFDLKRFYFFVFRIFIIGFLISVSKIRVVCFDIEVDNVIDFYFDFFSGGGRSWSFKLKGGNRGIKKDVVWKFIFRRGESNDFDFEIEGLFVNNDVNYFVLK